MRRAARDAFADRDPSASVADLVEDSLLALPPRPGPRRLVFRGRLVARGGSSSNGQAVHDVHVAVSVQPDDERDGARVLTAACDEPKGRLVAVTSVVSPADDGACPAGAGPWVVHVPAGLVRLVLDVHGRRLRTTWVRV